MLDYLLTYILKLFFFNFRTVNSFSKTNDRNSSTSSSSSLVRSTNTQNTPESEQDSTPSLGEFKRSKLLLNHVKYT